LRAEIGAGSKRTKATNGAALETPLANEFAAVLPKSTEGNKNLRKRNAAPETKTETHHGHSTNRLSIDSSFRGISSFFSFKITLCAML
jgi:hypothetical protein